MNGGRGGARRTKLVALVCTLAGAGGALLVTGIASTIAQSGSGSVTSTTVQDDAESGGLLFVQNAASGSRIGGENANRFRIVLRDVDPEALYFSDRPRRIAGVLTVPEMLRTLGFEKAGEPDPNAVLEVDAGSGSDALAVELIRPRYERSKDLLSFTARRLKTTDVTARTPFRAKLDRFGDSLDTTIPAHFGRAALFIDNGGNDCQFDLRNNLSDPLTLVAQSHWSTDSWKHSPPGSVAAGETVSWESEGGFARGCHNSVTYSTSSGQQMTFSGTDPYSGDNSAICTNSAGPAFCLVDSDYNRSGDELEAPAAVCTTGNCVLPPEPPGGPDLG